MGKYFWFAPNNRKLANGDNRIIKVGRTHKVKYPIGLCNYGLHASKRIIDALKYAPGNILCLVTLSGEIIHGDDKSVATERTYLAIFNAEKLLQEFARKQALINIEKIKPYTNKYDLIFEYLQTGNEEIRLAARSASESAARSATRSAAELAALSAESAAWLAARSAAWSAAKLAAELAALSAESAAWLAARSAAEKMLIEMVKEKTGWKI